MAFCYLLCVWKEEELQQCLTDGTGLFNLAAKISQSLTESFNMRISSLKLKDLAAVATCIVTALARAEPDVQLMPGFIHLLLILNTEKRGKKG